MKKTLSNFRRGNCRARRKVDRREKRAFSRFSALRMKRPDIIFSAFFNNFFEMIFFDFSNCLFISKMVRRIKRVRRGNK